MVREIWHALTPFIYDVAITEDSTAWDHNYSLWNHGGPSIRRVCLASCWSWNLASRVSIELDRLIHDPLAR